MTIVNHSKTRALSHASKLHNASCVIDRSPTPRYLALHSPISVLVAHCMLISNFYFAYFFVQSLACSSNFFLSFLNSSAAVVSTASSGTGSTNKFCAAASTAEILLDGFHTSPLSMPRHIDPCSSLVTFG